MQNLDELNALAGKLADEGLDQPTETVDNPLGKIGEVYGKVRPFLVAIGNLFFIPRNWRSTILTFVVIMDGLTATGELPNEPV